MNTCLREPTETFVGVLICSVGATVKHSKHQHIHTLPATSSLQSLPSDSGTTTSPVTSSANKLQSNWIWDGMLVLGGHSCSSLLKSAHCTFNLIWCAGGALPVLVTSSGQTQRQCAKFTSAPQEKAGGQVWKSQSAALTSGGNFQERSSSRPEDLWIRQSREKHTVASSKIKPLNYVSTRAIKATEHSHTESQSSFLGNSSNPHIHLAMTHRRLILLPSVSPLDNVHLISFV